MPFRKYLRNPFKKIPGNYFKQAESLIYDLKGSIEDSGTVYEIFRSEETVFNFNGEGELPTIPFRIRPVNGDSNVESYYLLVSSNGHDKLKLRWNEELLGNVKEPENFLRIFLNEFLLLPSEKNKNIN